MICDKYILLIYELSYNNIKRMGLPIPAAITTSLKDSAQLFELESKTEVCYLADNAF